MRKRIWQVSFEKSISFFLTVIKCKVIFNIGTIYSFISAMPLAEIKNSKIMFNKQDVLCILICSTLLHITWYRNYTIKCSVQYTYVGTLIPFESCNTRLVCFNNKYIIERFCSFEHYIPIEHERDIIVVRLKLKLPWTSYYHF